MLVQFSLNFEIDSTILAMDWNWDYLRCHCHGPGAVHTLLNNFRSAIALARGSRKSFTEATISPNDPGAPVSLAFLMKPRH